MTKFVTGPIAAVAGGIFAMGVKMGNTADEILDLASATGMSTEAIQEYRAVADRAGVSQDAVAKASEMLTKSMSRGAEGSADMRDAMEKLGLSLDQVREMSPDERMETLIGALQGVEDAGERAELGNKLLRNGYKELAPILDMTQDEMGNVIDQAHETGRVMGGEALENADQFRKGLDELKGEFTGLFNNVMGDIMPMLKDELIPAIKDNVIPLLRGFGEHIGNLIKWFANLDPKWQGVILGAVGLAAALGPVLMILGPIITAIGTLAPLFGVLKVVILALSGPIGLIVLAIAGLVAAGWLLYDNWEEITEWLKATWEKTKDFFIDLWDKIKEIFWAAMEWAKQMFWDYHPAVLVFKHWDEIKGYFVKLWDSVKSTFWDALDALESKFTDTWDGMKTVFKNAANFKIGGVNVLISAFENMVNAIAGAINSMPKFDVPDWIPGIGGKTFGLPKIPKASFPRVPYFDQGGIVPGALGSPQLIMAHGGETVLPTHKRAQTANITVYLDSEVIARAIGEPFVNEIRVRTAPGF